VKKGTLDQLFSAITL